MADIFQEYTHENGFPRQLFPTYWWNLWRILIHIGQGKNMENFDTIEKKTLKPKSIFFSSRPEEINIISWKFIPDSFDKNQLLFI